ncbi:MAG: gephyrin-like molybdotransferase Glp [Candidatus Omnitrophota bacterium]
MISLQKARDIIRKETPVLPSERVELSRSLDRVLAEDIKAAFDMPPFDRAAMDGYAVNAVDTRGAGARSPVVLKVCGEIPAGAVVAKIAWRKAGQASPPRREGKWPEKGSATSIMTGAVLPVNCDSVVKIEETEEFTENQEKKVRIFKEVEPGRDISFRGEDLKKGETILKKGRIVTPATLAMLAYLGRKEVKVFRKPEVAIVATGDEIKKVGERLLVGQIYNSNSYGIYGQVLTSGGNPYLLGIARDNPASLSRFIKKGLEYDMLIMSGGVSAGKYDLVVGILEKMGVKMLFWKVAVKPGKPVFFGQKGKTVVFGLPGYPVSSYLCFEILSTFAFAKMLGRNKPEKFKIEAVLESELNNPEDRDSFIRVKIVWRNNRYFAIPYPTQKSGVLRSLTESDGIAHLKRRETKKENEKIMVEVFEGGVRS